MAGPIGMAVLAGMKAVTCPHCKRRQARDARRKGAITCKFCHKSFTPPARKR